MKLSGTLKGIGGVLLGATSLVALGLITVGLILGAAWVTERLLGPLITVGWIAITLDLLVLLPLSIVRPFRPYTGTAIGLSSYIFGLVTWLSGFGLAFSIWGAWAVIVGLAFAGVGVVSVALLATLLHGRWGEFLALIVLLVVTIGARIGGAAVASATKSYPFSLSRGSNTAIEPSTCGKSAAWWRWTLVLPVAAGAYAVASLAVMLVGLLPSLSPVLPEAVANTWCQIMNSVLPPAAAVYAAAKVAPRGRLVVGISLTVINAVACAVIVTASAVRGAVSPPLWYLVLTGVLGVVATIAVCAMLRHEEDLTRRSQDGHRISPMTEPESDLN